MDNLSHSLSATVFRAAAPNNLHSRKLFLIFALLAANAPDIDILFILKGTETYFQYHRGPTHSIFLIPIFGIILAGLAVWASKSQLQFKQIFIWFSGLVALHNSMDWVTSYGTELLWPFSTKPYTADLFPIVDPILIISMAITSIAVAIGPRARRSIVLIFVVFVVGYSCLRIHSKVSCEAFVRAQSGPIERIYSFPDTEELISWFSPQRFRVVTVHGKRAESYRVCAWSGKIEPQGSFELIDRFDERWEEIESYKLSRVFIKRSRLPVLLESENELIFADLRYTGNIGQNHGLALYFPMREGKISGQPEMIRHR